jgi:hypothetical protein
MIFGRKFDETERNYGVGGMKMKRFTFMVFVMFVILFGVMIRQTFGQQMKDGCFDTKIPYYFQYKESLEICAVKPLSVIDEIENEVLKLSANERIYGLTRMRSRYTEHYNRVMEYLNCVERDKYDDKHSISYVRSLYQSNYLEVISMFSGLALKYQ